MYNNITLDFTANKAVESLTTGQPLAIMPAALAKRLLQAFADRLVNSRFDDIVEEHVTDLRNCTDMGQVLQTSINFIQERELILNVKGGNWDAYAVEPIKTGDVLVAS